MNSGIGYPNYGSQYTRGNWSPSSYTVSDKYNFVTFRCDYTTKKCNITYYYRIDGDNARTFSGSSRAILNYGTNILSSAPSVSGYTSDGVSYEFTGWSSSGNATGDKNIYAEYKKIEYFTCTYKNYYADVLIIKLPLLKVGYQ